MSYPIKPETRLIQADNRGRLALNPWTDRHAQYTVERYPDGTMVVRPFQAHSGGYTNRPGAGIPVKLSDGGLITGEYVMPKKDLPDDPA